LAVRVRKSDGKILCAAIHEAQEGDVYINDSVHYYLSVEVRMLVTEPHEHHKLHGEWWWRGFQPSDVTIDSFYLRVPESDNHETTTS
jgi:hypothetical protein